MTLLSQLTTWFNGRLILLATPRQQAISNRSLLILVSAFGILYGVIMGSYSGLHLDRLQQLLYSGLKVPLLLTVTFTLTLPSYYVLNALLGLGHDFRRVLQAILKSQAALAITLASFSPLTILWYLSVERYNLAILFNAVMFGIASLCGQFILWRSYQPLIRDNPLHARLLPFWLIVYAFVGIQMGWVLRPFIGDPSLPPEFFRPNSWSNAYLVVFKLIVGSF